MDEIINKINTVKDWILRNGLLVAIIVIGLYLIGFQMSFLITKVQGAVNFAYIILLAAVGLYCYTKTPFTKIFLQGMNGRTDTTYEIFINGLVLCTMLVVATWAVIGTESNNIQIQNARSITQPEIFKIQNSLGVDSLDIENLKSIE